MTYEQITYERRGAVALITLIAPGQAERLDAAHGHGASRRDRAGQRRSGDRRDRHDRRGSRLLRRRRHGSDVQEPDRGHRSRGQHRRGAGRHAGRARLGEDGARGEAVDRRRERRRGRHRHDHDPAVRRDRRRPTTPSSACSSSRSAWCPSSPARISWCSAWASGAPARCASRAASTGAAEAHHAGLVDVLTTPDELLPKAFAIADAIAANPDPQLRMTKQLLTRERQRHRLGARSRSARACCSASAGRVPSTRKRSRRSSRSGRRASAASDRR